MSASQYTPRFHRPGGTFPRVVEANSADHLQGRLEEELHAIENEGLVVLSVQPYSVPYGAQGDYGWALEPTWAALILYRADRDIPAYGRWRGTTVVAGTDE